MPIDWKNVTQTALLMAIIISISILAARGQAIPPELGQIGTAIIGFIVGARTENQRNIAQQAHEVQQAIAQVKRERHDDIS